MTLLKNRFYIFFVLLILIFSSCKTNKDINKSTKEDHPELYNKYYNENYSVEIIPNEQGNYLLYLFKSKTNTQNPNFKMKFFVTTNTKDKILYEGIFDNTIIQWLSNNELQLTQYLGINNKTNNKSTIEKIININTKEIKTNKIENKPNKN